MGGLIGVGVALINLFLSGPLLTFAWRSRGYLADATAVELTRDADGLARALTALGGEGRSVPGTAWLELLLVVGGSSGGSPAGRLPRLSDSGLATSLAPPLKKRLARLRAMGASSVPPSAPSGLRERARGRSRLPIALLLIVIIPLIALLAVLLAIAVVLIVYLVAFAAFVVLAIVAGPLHELLRSLAGR